MDVFSSIFESSDNFLRLLLSVTGIRSSQSVEGFAVSYNVVCGLPGFHFRDLISG